MYVLPMSRLLLEHNGDLSVEVNLFEPKVAEGDLLLPTPTSLVVEGSGPGMQFGNNKYWRAVEVVLDDELRSVMEHSSIKTHNGNHEVMVERSWEGTDYVEQRHLEGGETVKGYRVTQDNGDVDVLYQGDLYKLSKEEVCDECYYLWRISGDDGLKITSKFDSDGKIRQETKTSNKNGVRTSNFIYDVNGNLITKVVSPGVVMVDGMVQDFVVNFERRGEDIVVVKSLAFPKDPDSPARTETRHYGRSGEYQRSEVVEGYIDLGRSTLKHTATYKMPVNPAQPNG